jgi:S1-C subfamily serine protease
MAGGPHWLLEDWGDAEFASLTPGLGRYFGAEQGVLVVRAPADASLGLQDGDVIVTIGGREPENGRHAMRILRSYQPGEAVELKILRDRRAQTLNAKVPARTEVDVLRRRHPPAPPVPPAPPAAATTD